jgi:glycosyltransferase involved in cell wall biosynthesis
VAECHKTKKSGKRVSRSTARLLIVIPTLTAGGAERVVVTLLRHLSRGAFEIHLAIMDTRGAVYRNELSQDVTVHDLRALRVRAGIVKIIRLVRQLRPDVIFSTLGHLNFVLSLVSPLFPRGIRLIGRETNMPTAKIVDPERPKLWWFTYTLAYRRLIRRFDLVISQSFAMRDDLIRVLHVSPAKTVVIHNPIDRAQISDLAREPENSTFLHSLKFSLHLVAAGRLVPVKGFHLLLQALALLPERVSVTILGTGPEERNLKKLAFTLGVTDRVEFLGLQENPYRFFARADAVIVSSYSESFPNVALEALACGTPVIATPATGGIRELLEGIDGCVIANAVSAEALARAIGQFRTTRIITSSIARFDAQSIALQYERALWPWRDQLTGAQHGSSVSRGGGPNSLHEGP